MNTLHPDPDQLVALALADASAEDQERLATHLAECATCRDDYAQIFDGLQQTLAAAVSVDPPAGFSGRVLDAIAAGSEGVEVARPPRLRLLVAACLLVGLMVGVGGSLGISSWLNRAPSTTTMPAPSAVRLLNADGVEVGSVGLTQSAGRAFVALHVTNAPSGARYECLLVQADGTRISGGAWTLVGKPGSATANGAWMVPISGTPPVGVELVTPGGMVWARGTF